MASLEMLVLWRMTSLTRHHLLQQTRQKWRTGMGLKALAQQRLQNLRQNQKLKEHEKPIDQVESLLAQNLIRQNEGEFSSIKRAEEKMITEEAVDKDDLAVQASQRTSFPYHIERNDEMFNAKLLDETTQPEETPALVVDKGFFVKGNEYVDEYMAATAADLPEEEMNECPYHFVGNDDAVETIDFQMPGQSSNFAKNNSSMDEENDDDEWKANYSSEDASVTVEVKSSCTGCGAKLHCHDTALPGFVPVEILKDVIDKEAKNSRKKSPVHIDELCRRCYMLKNHNFLLNVNVCEVDYEKIMGHLKLVQEALILLVVDMTDIYGSIYRQLPNVIGDSKPMIVIGNKVDLLPPDAHPGYLKRFRDSLNVALNETGLSQRFNIMHTALVSAKTGYGIEDLITNIYLKWMNPHGQLRSDMYLVGNTNAGKSTLFNSFLQSDLCKVRAMDLAERVTTSVWPGTTLSLLKFPLMNPSTHKLELRKRRLLMLMAWAKKEESAKHMLYSSTKDPQFLTLSGAVANTFKEKEDETQPITDEEINASFSHENGLVNPNNLEPKLRRALNLSHPEFQHGNWCFDTPGTVSRDQLLDVYTLEELITLVPRKLITPQMAVIHPGESLLFGGTARLDLISSELADAPIYLTIFCSDRLPLHVLKTKEVESFLDKFNGTKVVGIPFGGKERLDVFPTLKGKKIRIMESGYDKAMADIVLSSIGWVTVNSHPQKILLRALTPDGRGIITRQPILPFAWKYKGSRIPGTSFYNMRPLRFDAEEPKKNFHRRRR